jgi:eukaryotic-like serine/threonine-protein kinase
VSSPWVGPLTGRVLGGYRLERCIGAGAFGLVFEVTSTDTSAAFAMKVLPPASQVGPQVDFDNEGILLKKLVKCSSVINLIESGAESIMVTLDSGMAVPLEVKYHVLALASGTLEELIIAPETLSQLAWPERISLWRGAIKAVHQMHLKSVAHRDLKSSNCLLMVSNARSEVRLADLGRSKDFSQPPLHPAEFYWAGAGDARFAPPECLWLQGGLGEVDFRNADLYGLGSLFVELTTGHPMTALGMTSWIDARKQGIVDLRDGVIRDLATLRPQYRAAIEALAEELPSAIRHDGVRLITQLCDPVPHARQPKRGLGRRQQPENGLTWLLNQADILCRRLAVTPRRSRYNKRVNERSA